MQTYHAGRPPAPLLRCLCAAQLTHPLSATRFTRCQHRAPRGHSSGQLISLEWHQKILTSRAASSTDRCSQSEGDTAARMTFFCSLFFAFSWKTNCTIYSSKFWHELFLVMSMKNMLFGQDDYFFFAAIPWLTTGKKKSNVVSPPYCQRGIQFWKHIPGSVVSRKSTLVTLPCKYCTSIWHVCVKKKREERTTATSNSSRQLHLGRFWQGEGNTPRVWPAVAAADFRPLLSFSQTSLERWQRGPCHTPPCCGWKRTARQRWVHAADPDSHTAAAGSALPTGLLSPVTPCQPSVRWAPRRTTGAKVTKKNNN